MERRTISLAVWRFSRSHQPRSRPPAQARSIPSWLRLLPYRAPLATLGSSADPRALQTPISHTATITSQPVTGQTANYTGSSTDYSFNPLAFDGLIPQSIAGGCYYKSLGATLTADGANGVVEIDAALKYLWDNYRIGHGLRIYCGAAQGRDILKKIMTGSGNAAMRINLQNNTQSLGQITGSARVGSYTNKYAWETAGDIPIEVHPNMPDGNIYIDLEENPYPTANIAQARAVRTRRDYFQVIWPIVTRQWPNGIYSDEMLQMYFPQGACVIQNVLPG